MAATVVTSGRRRQSLPDMVERRRDDVLPPEASAARSAGTQQLPSPAEALPMRPPNATQRSATSHHSASASSFLMSPHSETCGSSGSTQQPGPGSGTASTDGSDVQERLPGASSMRVDACILRLEAMAGTSSMHKAAPDWLRRVLGNLVDAKKATSSSPNVVAGSSAAGAAAVSSAPSPTDPLTPPAPSIPVTPLSFTTTITAERRVNAVIDSALEEWEAQCVASSDAPTIASASSSFGGGGGGRHDPPLSSNAAAPAAAAMRPVAMNDDSRGVAGGGYWATAVPTRHGGGGVQPPPAAHLVPQPPSGSTTRGRSVLTAEPQEIMLTDAETTIPEVNTPAVQHLSADRHLQAALHSQINDQPIVSDSAAGSPINLLRRRQHAAATTTPPPASQQPNSASLRPLFADEPSVTRSASPAFRQLSKMLLQALLEAVIFGSDEPPLSRSNPPPHNSVPRPQQDASTMTNEVVTNSVVTLPTSSLLAVPPANRTGGGRRGTLNPSESTSTGPNLSRNAFIASSGGFAAVQPSALYPNEDPNEDMYEDEDDEDGDDDVDVGGSALLPQVNSGGGGNWSHTFEERARQVTLYAPNDDDGDDGGTRGEGEVGDQREGNFTRLRPAAVKLDDGAVAGGGKLSRSVSGGFAPLRHLGIVRPPSMGALTTANGSPPQTGAAGTITRSVSDASGGATTGHHPPLYPREESPLQPMSVTMQLWWSRLPMAYGGLAAGGGMSGSFEPPLANPTHRPLAGQRGGAAATGFGPDSAHASYARLPISNNNNGSVAQQPVTDGRTITFVPSAVDLAMGMEQSMDVASVSSARTSMSSPAHIPTEGHATGVAAAAGPPNRQGPNLMTVLPPPPQSSGGPSPIGAASGRGFPIPPGSTVSVSSKASSDTPSQQLVVPADNDGSHTTLGSRESGGLISTVGPSQSQTQQQQTAHPTVTPSVSLTGVMSVSSAAGTSGVMANDPLGIAGVSQGGQGAAGSSALGDDRSSDYVFHRLHPPAAVPIGHLHGNPPHGAAVDTQSKSTLPSTTESPLAPSAWASPHSGRAAAGGGNDMVASAAAVESAVQLPPPPPSVPSRGASVSGPNFASTFGFVNNNAASFMGSAADATAAAAALSRQASIMSMAPHSRPHLRTTDQLNIDDTDPCGYLQINQYLLTHSLGKGAQGEVFAAQDLEQDELRAIKVVSRPNVMAAANARHRRNSKLQLKQLEEEIAIMTRCRHKNVVSLYEVIDDPQHHQLYLVMQYVEHGSIAKVNPDGSFSGKAVPIVDMRRMLSIARQLCAGLHYLHDRSVAHCDIKPENILRGANDTVYLADFGISVQLQQQTSAAVTSDRNLVAERRRAAAGRLTGAVSPVGAARDESGSPLAADSPPAANLAPATFLGTLAFSAPEAFGGHNTDATTAAGLGPKKHEKRGDIWALGMVFYGLLAGRLPFSLSATSGGGGSAMMSYIEQVTGPQPVPMELATSQQPSPSSSPVTTAISIPRLFRPLLSGMLEKDPAKRLTISEVRGQLKQMALGGETSS